MGGKKRQEEGTGRRKGGRDWRKGETGGMMDERKEEDEKESLGGNERERERDSYYFIFLYLFI